MGNRHKGLPRQSQRAAGSAFQTLKPSNLQTFKPQKASRNMSGPMGPRHACPLPCRVRAPSTWPWVYFSRLRQNSSAWFPGRIGPGLAALRRRGAARRRRLTRTFPGRSGGFKLSRGSGVISSSTVGRNATGVLDVRRVSVGSYRQLAAPCCFSPGNVSGRAGPEGAAPPIGCCCRADGPIGCLRPCSCAAIGAFGLHMQTIWK